MLELESRSGHEVFDRAGDEHLSGSGVRGHSSARVHGNTADALAAYFTLPRMEACPRFDAELPDRLVDGLSTPDASSGAVEGGQDAIPSGVDLATSIVSQFPTYKRIGAETCFGPPTCRLRRNSQGPLGLSNTLYRVQDSMRVAASRHHKGET